MKRSPLKAGLTQGKWLVPLCLLLPLMVGGCPEFQNDVVNAFDVAVSGLLNAALDLFFDQFRSDVF